MKAGTMMKLFALAAALLALAVAVPAQEGGTSGSIVAGGEAVTGDYDSPRLEQYETVPRGFVMYGATFTWDAKSGYFVDFSGSKFGYDDQSERLVWGKKGVFKLEFTWDSNPNYFSDTGRTLYVQQSANTFTLPYPMRVYLQETPQPTPNPPNVGLIVPYLANAAPVELRYVREKGGLKFEYTGVENWVFKVGYTHETRNGTKPQPFSIGRANLEEFAMPVNYLTEDYTVSADWAKGRWFFSGSYDYNKFTNEDRYFNVDNAFRYQDSLSAGPAFARIGTAPDNSAWTLSFTGGVSLPYRHRLVADVDWGQMKQDQGLLPFTSNMAYYTDTPEGVNMALPITAANRKIDTFLGMVRLTGEPLNWFGYSVSYRRHEMDNKAPHTYFQNWIYGDQSVASGGRYTTAVGYSTDTWKAEVHFDPVKQVRFGLEFKDNQTDLQDREFTSNKETLWRATLDLDFAPWVSFRASYADVKLKNGGENHETPHLYYPSGHGLVEAGPQHEAHSTRYDIWRRDSDVFNALLSFTPLNNLYVGFSYQDSKDKYPDSHYGLEESKYDNWGIDVSYAASNRLSFYGSYLDENTHSAMWSRWVPVTTSGGVSTAWQYAVNDWGHKYDENVKTYTLGFSWDAVPGKFDLTSDYSYSKGRDLSAYTYVPGFGGTTSPQNAGDGWYNDGYGMQQITRFPEVYNKLVIWKTYLNYHFNKNLALSVGYWYQKYDGQDWAEDVMTTYMGYAGLAPSLTKSYFLGATVPNYDANIFQAFVSFKF